jgi:hypothetical protein
MFSGLFCSKSLTRLAALSCLVALWCCASSAEATCGDYLSHASEMTSPQSGDPLAPAPPATPCRGPTCQRAPDHPPLPAPQRVVIVPTRDILSLIVSSNELALDAQWLALPNDRFCPSCFGLTLFRPPRSIT